MTKTEEILRGLTAHAIEKDCNNCPYNPMPNGCIDRLMQDAAGEIRELIGEGEMLRDQVQNLTLYLQEFDGRIPITFEAMAEKFSGLPGYNPSGVGVADEATR